jgi:hypothetical protein
MNRIERLEKKLARIEAKKNVKEKKFKLNWKVMSKLKKGNKMKNHVVVQYLTREYQIRFKICRVISGNLVVIDNKVHILNPKKMFGFGRYRWYIIREIDRSAVSNEDIEELKEAKRDTEEDVPLIKAVLGAVHKPSPIASKNAWIAIGVIAAIAIIIFFIMRGG